MISSVTCTSVQLQQDISGLPLGSEAFPPTARGVSRRSLGQALAEPRAPRGAGRGDRSRACPFPRAVRVNQKKPQTPIQASTAEVAAL